MEATELNVKFTGKSTVRASNTTIDPYTASFSNFDLLSGRQPVTVIFAYSKPYVRDYSSVLALTKTSLAETLNHYLPFSGRIALKAITGEPEIVCNNQGVEVIEAHVNVDLASLDFHDLTQSLQKILIPLPYENPVQVQVTSYTCGSVSISWSFNHVVADAAAFGMFIISWCEVAQKKPISKYPDHRRFIFSPRSPPSYSPTLDRNFINCTMEEIMSNTQTKTTAYDVSLKRLYFIDASDIQRLQKVANRQGQRKTKLEAFSAYLWKLLALAVEEEECDTRCNMGWLVEGRGKMNMPVSNLIGNVLTMAVGESSVEELNKASLSDVASKAHEAITEVNNGSHFLDLIDWIECHKPAELFLAKILLGMKGPAVIVSSTQFPIREVDLGFGPPVLGTCYSTLKRLGAAYVNPQPSPRGDGSLVVFTVLWPKLAAALESHHDHVFRPMTSTCLGLTTPLISRY